ncbi:g287 [Coccomyxa elongata]
MNDCTALRCLVLGALWGRVCGFDLELPTSVRTESPAPPLWAPQYKVSWELAVPYVSKLQSTPLLNRFDAWQDAEHGRQKLTKDGVETTIEKLGEKGEDSLQYQIYPRIDKLDCRTDEIGGGAGPTAQTQRRLLQSDSSSNAAKLGLVLPDLTESRWLYNGSTLLQEGRHANKTADAWVWRVTNDEGYGEYHNTYTFYVDKDGNPLRLNMWGVNLYTGGHFDLYISDYFDYKAGEIDEQEFDVPSFCPEKPDPDEPGSNGGRFHRNMGGIARMRSLLPNAHYGDEEYDVFVLRHGRRHRSAEEYEGRRQVYQDNKLKVQEWNAGSNAHQLDVNHFADWTQEEFEALMLPNKGRPRPSLGNMAFDNRRVKLHRPTVAKHLLPSYVDWRGTPADSPVKDQAACGSCWAFGSVASMETAYYRETGKQLLLSEQHFIDCAWDAGNTGCLGGFQPLAFNWMADVLELATEEAYPYQGVTNFCKKNVTDKVRFKKFSQVWVNATDSLTQEEAVMEAIYTKGPMTVSVNAEGEDWRFYKAGIYNNTRCSPKLKKLDHAVVVSGYGETEDGQKYWIVKNTWSANWGEKGYIRISRDPAYDCGIATQAIYNELELAD